VWERGPGGEGPGEAGYLLAATTKRIHAAPVVRLNDRRAATTIGIGAAPVVRLNDSTAATTIGIHAAPVLAPQEGESIEEPPKPASLAGLRGLAGLGGGTGLRPPHGAGPESGAEDGGENHTDDEGTDHDLSSRQALHGGPHGRRVASPPGNGATDGVKIFTANRIQDTERGEE